MIIDFHAHMHPGADHGCPNTETARRQLELAHGAGVGAVVTVSHYYPMRDSVDSYLARRERAQDKLTALCEADAGLPKVYFGTEVTLCPGLHKLEQLPRLCVGGTRLLLVEMPFDRWDSRLIDTLDSIRYDLKLTPLLAHLDRYDRDNMGQLLREGYTGQLNIEPLSGFFGRRRLINWAERGYISALGSDIHGVEMGYKHLPKARGALGESLFDSIMAKSAELLKTEENK